MSDWAANSLIFVLQDLGKYLKEYQDLNALKLSLEQEINIYHKLLLGERYLLIFNWVGQIVQTLEF